VRGVGGYAGLPQQVGVWDILKTTELAAAMSAADAAGAAVPVRRNLTALAVTRALSIIGDEIYYVGVMWLAYKLTGLYTAPAVLGILTASARLVVSPFAGALADRHDRRTLMIAMDFGRALVVLLLLLATTWHPSLLFIYLVTPLLGAAESMFHIALAAVTPELVADQRQVVQANALLTTVMRGVQTLGLVAGGVLAALVPWNTAVGVNAVSFVLSGLVLFLLHPRREPGTVDAAAGARPAGEALKSPPGTWEQLRSGWRYVRQETLLWTMIVMSVCINPLLQPVVILLPGLTEMALGGTAVTYGWLLALFSVGVLVGSVVLMAFPPTRRRGWLVGGAIVVVGAGLLAFGLVRSLAGAAVSLTLLGVSIALLDIIAISLLQSLVPADRRGVVIGLISTASSAAIPLSLSLAGPLADLTSPGAVICACGSAGLLLAAYGLSRPQLRQLD